MSATFNYRTSNNLIQSLPTGAGVGTWELAGRTLCLSNPDDDNSPRVPCSATAANGFTISFDEPFYSLTLPTEPGGVTISDRPGATQKYYGVDVSFVKRLCRPLVVPRQLRVEQLQAVPDVRVLPGPEQSSGRGQLRFGAGGQCGARCFVPRDRLVVQGFGLLNANWQFNVSALYQGPWGLDFGVNFFGRQGYPNPYYVRTRATDAAGNSHRYHILIDQVDTYRYDNVYELDFRLAKTFTIGGMTVIPAAELFNVANSGTVLQRTSESGDIGPRPAIYSKRVLQRHHRGAESADREAWPLGQLLGSLRGFRGRSGIPDGLCGFCRPWPTLLETPPGAGLPWRGGSPPAAERPPAQRRQERPPAGPRDIVLITIDTLRADVVGFDGNPRGTTPNLDRFAAEGSVFTQAHSHNVITLPSHTNILTGMLPYQHGVRENAGFRLSPRVPTAASRQKAKGYATGAFVGAYVLDSRYGLAHDFDVYDGALPASRRAIRVRHPAGSGRGRRQGGSRMVPLAGGQAAVPLGARLRSARSVRAARGVQGPVPGRLLSRRSVLHGCCAGAVARGAQKHTRRRFSSSRATTGSRAAITES